LSAPAPPGAPPPSRARRGLVRALKLVVVGALLAFVASRLPWQDRLLWKDGAQERELAGSIVGDWKQDRIGFDVAGADLSALPAELVQRLRAREQLERSATLDWQPGMPRVFGEVEAGGLVKALGLLALGVLVTATRWWRLLGAAGVRTRWLSALRLTSLGQFFSIVFPGLTGGDLVKAVLVAREHPGKRADAVVSVFVDRLLGLVTLIVMGALVIVLMGDDLADLRTPVLLILAGGVLGVLVYTSRGLRRLVRFDAILERLPMAAAIRSVDDAVLLYSRHKRVLLTAFALSLANHASVIAAVLVLCRAFGDRQLDYFDVTAVVSVSNTASALPIAPGGWGVGEAVYGYLFGLLGSTPALGVAVSVSYRLCMMVIGLLGGLFLLVPGARADLARIDDLKA
jgi:uncharacterized protein (TIRG00374 family)